MPAGNTGDPNPGRTDRKNLSSQLVITAASGRGRRREMPTDVEYEVVARRVQSLVSIACMQRRKRGMNQQKHARIKQSWN